MGQLLNPYPNIALALYLTSPGSLESPEVSEPRSKIFVSHPFFKFDRLFFKTGSLSLTLIYL